MSEAQKKHLAAKILFAVTETIREAKEVPSGVLYAGLMAHGCTLAQYEVLIDVIVRSGVVEKRGDLLVWKGAQ